MTMTKFELEEQVIRMQEKLTFLESKVDLMEIIIKQGGPAKQEDDTPKMVKMKQINTKDRTYFCKTDEEQRVFDRNNPGLAVESFNVELTPATAQAYLEDPENAKMFAKTEGGE